MDHTLIENDCDVSWKEFLVRHGIAPVSACEEAERFYQQYRRNELDVNAFLDFQLREFCQCSETWMRQLAQQHFHEVVEPRIYRDADLLISELAKQGFVLAICTSTNEIVARPIAEALGINNLMATGVEVIHGHCTGRISGPYLNGDGKVKAVQKFCDSRGKGLEDAAYYGDSLADVPLLKKVEKATVINPSADLRELADQYGWEIRHWSH